MLSKPAEFYFYYETYGWQNQILHSDRERVSADLSAVCMHVRLNLLLSILADNWDLNEHCRLVEIWGEVGI